MNISAVACAILSLVPHLDPARAESQAAIIGMLAMTVEDAATAVVNGAHESGFGVDYERCVLRGDGGDGLYGLGVGYQEYACAAPEVQTRMALKAMHDKGFPEKPLRAFRGYLGAHSDRWPEARARLSLWILTVERIKCACSF